MINDTEEPTSEYAVEQLLPPAVLTHKPWVTVACKTDLGRVRENNEDKFEYYLPEDTQTLASKGQIFVVCDGMGGHAAGQFASELTAKTFIEVYLNHPSAEPIDAMKAAVAAANRFVLQQGTAIPSRRGMGTTISALVLLQDKAYVIQVGDSRVYRLRKGNLECLTVDHTWVEEAIRAGMITASEAETHPYKHVLTRAIGADPNVEPDIMVLQCEAEDTYLLCSDGLLNHVEDPEIGELLRGHTPSEACWKLVSAALNGGGSDNTTVMVVRVDSIEQF